MASVTKSDKRSAKVFGELIGLVIGLVLIIYVAPRFSFITDEYSLWMRIGVYATVISAAFKILKHITTTKPLKHIFEIANLLVSTYSTYALVSIYPFDFARVGYASFDSWFRLALQIAVVAMVFAVAINFVQIFFPPKAKK